MCALSPFIPSFGFPLKDPVIHLQQKYIYEGTDIMEADLSQFPPTISQLDRSASISANNGCPTMIKKLYHNASERDRRKKINSLYSTLRSLLPAKDQTKKLSIPATVTCVLKYIPQLQQQVERMKQKKEELLSMISIRQDDFIHHQEKQSKLLGGNSLSCFSASWLSDTEAMIQISIYKDNENQLSEILFNLEEHGCFLMNASSFQTSGGRVFYNLHLKAERIYGSKCTEVLSEKLLSLFEMKEELFQ